MLLEGVATQFKSHNAPALLRTTLNQFVDRQINRNFFPPSGRRRA